MKKQRKGLSIDANMKHRKSAKGRELAKLIVLSAKSCLVHASELGLGHSLVAHIVAVFGELSVLPVVLQIQDPIEMDGTELFCQFEDEEEKPAPQDTS